MQNTMDLLMGRYDEPVRQSTPVSRYYHTACFNVNEKGTLTDEPAAPDTMIRSGMRRTLDIRYDRTFLYFVVEKNQQVVLLSGVLNNPAAGAIVTKPRAVSPSRPAGPRLLRGIGHRRTRTD